MPERIADMLCSLTIIAEYGRRLLDIIDRRALTRGFSTIAQFFGTARTSVILAHISRGIMRAVALERLLRQRAGTGRDLIIRERRDPTPPPQDPRATASPAAPPPATAQAAARRPVRRPGPQEELTLDNLPSMRQIEAEVRRRPPGRTLVAICLDFGIAPLLCAAPFGTHLFSLFRWYGGSFDKYFREIRWREKRFDRVELDHNPALGRPAQTRDDVKEILGPISGSFIGEQQPADPFVASPSPGSAVEAAATGPP